MCVNSQENFIGRRATVHTRHHRVAEANSTWPTCPYVPSRISGSQSKSTSVTRAQSTLSYWSLMERTTWSSRPLCSTFLKGRSAGHATGTGLTRVNLLPHPTYSPVHNRQLNGACDQDAVPLSMADRAPWGGKEMQWVNNPKEDVGKELCSLDSSQKALKPDLQSCPGPDLQCKVEASLACYHL